MRFVVCSLWTPEFETFGPQTESNKRRYAEKHGYRFTCDRSVRSERPPAWSKLPIVWSEFGWSDWVFWLDADAAVSNPDIRLESLIDADADLILAADANGLNTGSVLFRSCGAVLDLLRSAWSAEHLIHHPWWEQAAIVEALAGSSVRVKVDRRMQSCLENWQPNDFVFHAPSRSLEERTWLLSAFF